MESLQAARYIAETVIALACLYIAAVVETSCVPEQPLGAFKQELAAGGGIIALAAVVWIALFMLENRIKK